MTDSHEVRGVVATSIKRIPVTKDSIFLGESGNSFASDSPRGCCYSEVARSWRAAASRPLSVSKQLAVSRFVLCVGKLTLLRHLTFIALYMRFDLAIVTVC